MSRQGSKALGDSGDGENNHWPVRGPRHVADDGCRSSVVHRSRCWWRWRRWQVMAAT